MPAFFAVSIGWVLLTEIMAEPYGWVVAGTQIDNGSRVVSMLAPTLLWFAFLIASVAAIAAGAVASISKGGRAELQRYVGLVSGKRLD